MKWKSVLVTAKNGDIIYEGSVREDYIIEKSKELYNEEDPCIIYRTHIMKSLYLAIWEQMKESRKKKLAVDCNFYQELLAPLAVDTVDATLEFR